ncbi:hypothetical protein JN27_09540 [Massilia sp. BSC265]|nr:hypothetical protein JN27_09540 [Massilia sp. BSC265]
MDENMALDAMIVAYLPDQFEVLLIAWSIGHCFQLTFTRHDTSFEILLRFIEDANIKAVNARPLEFVLCFCGQVDQESADANSFHLLGHMRHPVLVLFGARVPGSRQPRDNNPG